MKTKSLKYWCTVRFYYSQNLENGNTPEVSLRKAIRWSNEDCFDSE